MAKDFTGDQYDFWTNPDFYVEMKQSDLNAMKSKSFIAGALCSIGISMILLVLGFHFIAPV